MAARRYDKCQGSNLVARKRGLGNVLHELHAGNEGIYIRDQGSIRYVGQMIGSLVLYNPCAFGERYNTEILDCSNGSVFGQSAESY